MVSVIAFVVMSGSMLSSFTLPVAAAATVPPLDLAAMALQPGDLPESGYGIRDGGPIAIADMAKSLAALHGGATTEEQRLARELTGAGWKHAYVWTLGLLDPNDPSFFVSEVQTQIIEFSSTAGAGKGFTITENERVTGISQHKPSSRIGEQALITLNRRSANDKSNPQVISDLTFQDANLVATVSVTTYGANTAPPTDSTLEHLAGTLAKRIATVREGKDAPGLSTRALLLTGSAINTYYANYELLGGVTIRYAGETRSTLASRESTYKTNKVTDSFYATQTSGEYGKGNYGLYSLHVQRFAREADAVSWLQRMTPAGVVADGTQAKTTEIRNAPKVGDQSITYRYSYVRADESKAGGYVVILRTGRTVASVQIDGVPALSLATVGKVASAQAACQKAGDCRKPLKSPLPAPSVPATPAATPAAWLPERAAGVL